MNIIKNLGKIFLKVYLMFKLVKIDDLKNLTLFENLNNKELQEIANFSKIKIYSKNEIVYYESEITKDLYYLKTGHLKVYKVNRFENEIFLYDIKDDTLITKVSSLEDKIICTFGNIEALKESEILIINYEKFSNFCFNHPKLLMKLINIFAQKVNVLECLINRELTYDGVAKVAFTLVNEPNIFTELKKHEIANRLNLQPETLSRILKKLVRKELIEVNRHSVKIIDIEGLKEIFE